MAAAATMAATAMATTAMATTAMTATAMAATAAMNKASVAAAMTGCVIAVMHGDMAVLSMAKIISITMVVVPADKDVPFEPGITIKRLVAEIGRV